MKKLALVALFITLSGCNAHSVDLNSQPTEQAKIGLVDTGQHQAYTTDGVLLTTQNGLTLWGQDSHYQGTPFVFAISNNQQTVLDINTGLTWQRVPPDDKFSWRQAGEYCAALTLAEHSDWRLPSLTELMSIQDFSEGWPYLDTDVFSIGNQTIGKHLQYWSSNLYQVGTTHNGAETAFGLNFGTGHIKGYPTGDGDNLRPPPRQPRVDNTSSDHRPPSAHRSGHKRPRGNPAYKLARCVRGAAYGESQFVDNGDGTVSDLTTGLMWLKQDSGKPLDWQQALDYAESLDAAGYDDWKLPNVKELQSIVDYSGVYPAIDRNFFQITDKDSYFWSSTSAYFSKFAGTEERKTHWAWYVAFGYAVDPHGNDVHGAGAVRFDTKHADGPASGDGERVFNYARAVRLIEPRN